MKLSLIFTSLVSAIAASFFTYSLLSAPQWTGANDDGVSLESLSKEIRLASQDIEKLNAGLTDLRHQVNNQLSSAISAISAIQEQTANDRPVAAADSAASLQRRYADDPSPRGQSSLAEDGSRPNPEAQAHYESDQGKPLRQYSDTIQEVFQNSANILELQDIHCKQSICKVSYSLDDALGQAAASEFDDPATQIIDKLSRSMKDVDLNIGLAVEENGDKVMDIRMQEKSDGSRPRGAPADAHPHD